MSYVVRIYVYTPYIPYFENEAGENRMWLFLAQEGHHACLQCLNMGQGMHEAIFRHSELPLGVTSSVCLSARPYGRLQLGSNTAAHCSKVTQQEHEAAEQDG
jgi:hypothetical protein